ncbi:MAG: CoA ester lyase [Maricaulaceae bacterium]
MSVKLRRSILYVPGSNGRAIEKARDLGADVVVYDLEDAVAPDMKAEARANVVAELARAEDDRFERVVRVNSVDSAEGVADLEQILPAAPDAICIPKVDDAETIADVCAAFDSAHAQRGLALWAMIETPKALLHLREIAETGARRRLAALVVGSNDIAEALGLGPGLHDRRAALRPLLMQVVVAARAHSLFAFDGVYNDYADAAGFDRETREARAFGFDGKTLIHPSQVEPCHRAYAPTAEELGFARGVVAAFQEPENLKRGAISVDGKMVERMHYDAALEVLARAGETVERAFAPAESS